MSWLSGAELDRLEAAVREAESKSSAELVVVLSRRADAYREAAVLAGALVGLIALAVIIYHPASFNEHAIVPDVAIAGALGWLAAGRMPRLVRALTTAERRREAAVRADRAVFVEHAVAATRDRTGILVHVCELEQHLAIVPDLAIQARVPSARFNAIVAEFQRAREAQGLVRALDAAIRAVGPAVSTEFPRAADDVNELPDRPRVED